MGLVIIFVMLIICVVIIGLAYDAHEKKNKLEGNYNAIFYGTLKHISGLPIASDAAIEVCYCQDKFVFLNGKQEITLALDKVKSVDCVTKNDLSKAMTGAAAGKYILGGLTGAVIGSITATDMCLIISYESSGENKLIALNQNTASGFGKKVENAFKNSSYYKETKIDL